MNQNPSKNSPNNMEGIRFGICARPEEIAAAAAAGYDYVELNLNDVLGMDEVAYRAMAGEMRKAGVYAEVASGLLPGDVPILGESVSAQRIHAALDRSFEAARALGAELVLFDFIPKDPGYMDLFHANEAPSAEFWFGTDTMGRDIKSIPSPDAGIRCRHRHLPYE